MDLMEMLYLVPEFKPFTSASQIPFADTLAFLELKVNSKAELASEFEFISTVTFVQILDNN